MAAASFSSTTTSSHTLSAENAQLPITDLHPSSGPALISTLSASPHSFLQPPPSLHSAALVLAKRYLDPLASAVTDAQSIRQQDARRKRKRGSVEVSGPAQPSQPLQLNRIYLDGLAIGQVWEQARRVLDAATDQVEHSFPEVLREHEATASTPAILKNGSSSAAQHLKALRFGQDGFEHAGSEGDSDEDGEMEPPDEHDAIENLGGPDFHTLEEKDWSDADEVDEGASDLREEHSGPDSNQDEPGEDFVEDPNGLNDGFFSIDAFNKQSEFMERQDAAGAPLDDDASEEEIDYDADPMATQSSIDARTGRDGADVGIDDDEDGPIFGNADLNAPEGDSDQDMDDMEEAKAGANAFDNTNSILYNDFFEPPPRKVSKTGRPSKHTRDVNAKAERDQLRSRDDNVDMQRTMDAVRRDLFEDDLSADGEDIQDADTAGLDPSKPQSRRSTHERRQAKLAEEIRSLEAANVAKREWTLSGEARAADRPLNSLLEEDLDFERTGKPVPVITAAVSEGIEEMIKRRILAQDFDEVIRRRPDDLANPASTRRGRFELDDSKPQQSLAEMYEEEHLRKVDPEGHKDKRDEKLEKEHAEIERLWTDVCGKLDALTSWRYKPKPPKPSVSIVADVPTVAMEDARPTAAVGSNGGGLGANSMLAPQEIYAPGKESMSKGEVVPKSGVPVAKEEMSRDQKVRRRRREKERLKKQHGGKDKDGKQDKKSKEKTEVIGALKKGGVKVIGRKGEIRDVEGKKVREQQGRGGSGFKL